MYTFYVKFQTLADDCSFFRGCALIRLRVWALQEAILGAIALYIRHLNLQLSRKQVTGKGNSTCGKERRRV